MERRGFLKALFGAAVVATAGTLLASQEAEALPLANPVAEPVQDAAPRGGAQVEIDADGAKVEPVQYYYYYRRPRYYYRRRYYRPRYVYRRRYYRRRYYY